jgi:hypothetical protein
MKSNTSVDHDQKRREEYDIKIYIEGKKRHYAVERVNMTLEEMLIDELKAHIITRRKRTNVPIHPYIR